MKGKKSLNRTKEIISVIMAYGFKDIIAVTPILKLVKNPIQKFNVKYKGIDLRGYTRGQRIRMACEELGTTFVKLGQILSNRSDILPKDIIDELKKLQNNVKPFDEKEAVAIIEQELQKPITEAFQSFDTTPKASASISQVHTAILKTGEKVAIKVKRPNIEENILNDIEIITWLSSILEKYNEEFALIRPEKLIKAFKNQLLQELDFNFEKNNTIKFQKFFKNNKNIKIAKIYEEYSTKNILTMEYIEGIKISDISPDDTKYDRKKLVSIGVDCVLEQIFKLGFFHADPHPGNLMALDNNVLCFLDFGMIGFIPPTSKEAFSSLIMSINNADYINLAKAVLDLCNHSEVQNMEDFNMAIFMLVNKYIDMPLENINIEDIFNELIVEHIKPFAFKYVKEQLKPDNLLKQSRNLINDYFHVLKNVPSDLGEVINLMRKGNIRIQLEHKKLETLANTLDSLGDRLSYSIVLASLIISSGLIIAAKMPPLINGISLVGLVGFLLSGIMGFIMVISRFIRKYVKKK